jgi:hypothetical protein
LSTPPESTPPAASPSDWEDLQSGSAGGGPTRSFPSQTVAMIAAAALVIGLLVGFAGGFLVERSRIRNRTHVTASAPAPTTAATNTTNPKGKVTAASATSVTMQNAKGKSVTFNVDSSTVVLKGTASQASAIAAGQNIFAEVQKQPDGSSTALRIVITQ